MTLVLSSIKYERRIVKNSLNSYKNVFPNATMPIGYPTIQTTITNLHNAIVAANNGTSTNVSDMHEEEKILVITMNLVKAHVDMVANTFANPDSVILSAGMTVAANSGGNAVTDLTLDAVGNGTVQIRVPRATADKAFSFQYALDSDPTNWQSIGFYSLSKINFNNQTPGTTLHFRYAPIGSNGMGAYSNSKSIMVV